MKQAKYDVIIIGSGLSGLLSGYILAKEGMQVCILEKNRRFGGCLQSFRRNGQTFDTGVHYFGSMDPGQTLHRYWKYFGLSDSLNLERMNPDGFDRIIIKGQEYPVAMGFDHFIEQLLPYFPKENDILQKYVRSLNEITSAFPLYNLDVAESHSELQYRSQGAFEFFQNLSSGESSLIGVNASRSRLTAVLAGNNFLYAGNRETTPIHIPALINHSYISSSWRPVNGSEQIADHLIKKIRDFGSDIFSTREVSKIEISDGIFNVQTGSSESFASKYLISSIAPSRTLKMLNPSLIRISTTNRINNLRNTLSSFAIYIQLKENCLKQLDYNCYMHKDENVWRNEETEDWPRSCMLYTPPDGTKDEFAKAMVIMTSMNYDEVRKWESTRTGNRGPDYLEFKERKADLMLNLAEIKFPGLRSSVASMETSTPLTWRDYTSTPDGSMYGIQKEFARPLETTIHPKTKIPNLFFTGQNTNLHGVLGVTIGAVLTCSEIVGLEMLLKKIRNG